MEERWKTVLAWPKFFKSGTIVDWKWGGGRWGCQNFLGDDKYFKGKRKFVWGAEIMSRMEG